MRNAGRYLPMFRQSRHAGSLFEVKTVLPRNEVDDGRPILLRNDYGLEGFSIVLGAKIDDPGELEAWGLVRRPEQETMRQ